MVHRLGRKPRTASSPPVAIDIDRILDAGPAPEETQVIAVPLIMIGFRFQSDDGLVLLDVDWKGGRTYRSYRVIDDAVLAVGDETGLVQVATTAVARGRVVLVLTCVLVSQNEPVTKVNLERVGLFLEHVLQWRL